VFVPGKFFGLVFFIVVNLALLKTLAQDKYSSLFASGLVTKKKVLKRFHQSGENSAPPESDCGIHTIEINPSRSV
jgi:hypothetical protein